ncbi:MAG: 5'-deoxyadenosine deaminase [Oligoflexia bacterium]|nr:5'-deoxyadenosine deaminase [Oligoflexia bacterium]
MRSILFTNGYLIRNEAELRIERSDLLVEDGRIQKVKKNISKTKNTKVIDLKGSLLGPGFIQTHLHLCQTLFRNLADELELLDWLSEKIWPLEAAHNRASLRSSAEVGIFELFSTGTTTILDMGTVRYTEEIFAKAEEMGIRAFIGKCLMDREHTYPGLREKTRDALRENEKLFQSWHGKNKGKIQYANAPRFVLSCTDQLLQEIRDFSNEHKLLIHTHSSENRAEIEAVRRIYGKENIEALHDLGLTNERLILAHGIWLSEREKDILKATKTKISHCPSSNLKLASGICSVPDLRARDICVSLGADGAPCNNSLNMFKEMRLASLIQKPIHGPKSMTAKEIYQMATLEGANALGKLDEIGSLSVGKKADLIQLDLARVNTNIDLASSESDSVFSALVYAADRENVLSTWVEGQCVYQKSKATDEWEKEIHQRAANERKRLLKRI